ncbi:hypothetical protein TorRG33x02_175720, partial [Trema orientale]
LPRNHVLCILGFWAPFEFEFWVSEHSNPPRLRAIYLQFSSSSASQIDRVTPFKFHQEEDQNGGSGFAQNGFLLNGFGSKFKEDEGYRPQEDEPSSSSGEEENNVDDGYDMVGKLLSPINRVMFVYIYADLYAKIYTLKFEETSYYFLFY